MWGLTRFINLLRHTNRNLESLHDFVMVWLVVILTLVILISVYILFDARFAYMTPDSKVLEVTWTLIPIVILVSIASPSIYLLCIQDSKIMSPFVTLKVISNQWNWQRESNEVIDHLLDSEKLDELRRYEYPLLLPLGKSFRVMLTRRDVLHSLGIPNLGIKLDSNPGRLNSVVSEADSLGMFSGSCYELCGRGHRAMPIYIISI